MNCIEADNIIYLENGKVEMSEDLMSKVTELQNQVKQYQNILEGVTAQLDAHKQMLNEALNTNLQLRTQNIMMQKRLNEVTEQYKVLQKELEELKKPSDEPKDKGKSKK